MDDVTDADRAKAEQLWQSLLAIDASDNGVAERLAEIEAALALALAKERKATHDDVVSGAWKGRMEAKVRELERARDEAQDEINRQKVRLDKRDGIIRAKNADLSDLAQERDRLRGALKAPGLYQPTVETDRKPTL